MSERPIECSQCKKPIKVVYKEMSRDIVTCIEMCLDCPILQSKLHGRGNETDEKESALCCGRCGTSLESVRMGEPLGCSDCYEIMGDFLSEELIISDAVPSFLHRRLFCKTAQIIHVGTFPSKAANIPQVSQLNALNEALKDELGRENYEQAAKLRDQIKHLKERIE